MRIKPSSLGFTLLLGAMAALPPLSIDMNLPSLPLLAREFPGSTARLGLTLSLFMAGFAVSQLVYGPASDRFGRRRPFLVGCMVYVLATGLCAVAPTMGALLAGRLLQGIGAGGGLVIAFAVTNDLFHGDAARAKLSYVTLVLSIAPMIAPSLGALVLGFGNWRWIFATLGAIGLVLLAAAWLGLAESNLRPDPGALNLRRLVANYRLVLSDRICLGQALVNAFGFGALFSYVAGSPLVLMGELGVSRTAYGGWFALTSAALLVAAGLNGRLAGAGVSARALTQWALAGSVVSAMGLLALQWRGHPGLLPLMGLLVVQCFARGIVSPNAAHAAIDRMPQMKGLTSAVLGCSQMVVGAVASAAVAALFGRVGGVAMGACITGFAIASALAYAYAESGGVTLRGEVPSR